MRFELLGIGFALALATGVFGLIAAGRSVGKRRLAEEGEAYSKGITAIEGALFGLLGLILAFLFSGALQRFDVRRQIVITEANHIGTAWLRIDVLPEESQAPMRDLFRRYLDSRIAAYHRLPDFVAFRAELAQSARLQGEIWKLGVPASASSSMPNASLLFLPSLNNMFDIVTTRTEAFRIHAPPVIFFMLAVLALACSLFAGYDMALRQRRNLLHSLSFAAVLAVTTYVILDLEYPRIGFINVFDSDRVLDDLRQSMN